MKHDKNITVIERDAPIGRYIKYRDNNYHIASNEIHNISQAKTIAQKFKSNTNFNVVVIKIKNVKPITYYVYVNEKE